MSREEPKKQLDENEQLAEKELAAKVARNDIASNRGMDVDPTTTRITKVMIDSKIELPAFSRRHDVSLELPETFTKKIDSTIYDEVIICDLVAYLALMACCRMAICISRI